ncbi:MAG: DUF2065 domain-containing protein [Alphaproteobacteria bacterium]|nr:DUF2065 domain-containing protein [Alphaproteobacteria bacterium]
MDDLWTSLAVAAGLVLFIEGLLYAAAPEAMKRAMAQILQAPSQILRVGGLIAAVVGLAIIWLIRG